jgi:hypothetical protein
MDAISRNHQSDCCWRPCIHHPRYSRQVIEIKNKYGETPARLKAFAEWIEVYLKFLTLQVRPVASVPVTPGMGTDLTL